MVVSLFYDEGSFGDALNMMINQRLYAIYYYTVASRAEQGVSICKRQFWLISQQSPLAQGAPLIVPLPSSGVNQIRGALGRRTSSTFCQWRNSSLKGASGGDMHPASCPSGA